MSTGNLFGGIVAAAEVERGFVDFLTAPDEDTGGTWIGTYLGELERLQGYAPGSIAPPRGVLTASEFEKWPEDELPVYIVICPGLVGVPVRRASSWEATFGVGVGCVAADPGVDGSSYQASRKLAQVHATAVRAAVIAHPSLGGMALTSTWLDESYTDMSFDDSRMLGFARVSFGVVMADVASHVLGPRKPLPDPVVDPGPLPEATIIDTEVRPVRADQEVSEAFA